MNSWWIDVKIYNLKFKYMLKKTEKCRWNNNCIYENDDIISNANRHISEENYNPRGTALVIRWEYLPALAGAQDELWPGILHGCIMTKYRAKYGMHAAAKLLQYTSQNLILINELTSAYDSSKLQGRASPLYLRQRAWVSQ